MGAYDIYT
jgi:IQ domain-containing protein H